MERCGFIGLAKAPFTLKSGIQSCVYVFGREDLTDYPKFEWLAGKRIAQAVWDADKPGDLQHCLIGIPTAGTALAQAAAMANYRLHYGGGYPEDGLICHRIMREMKKTHSAHQTWVNGKPDFRRHTYWVVDNVATDGVSKLEAAEKLEEDGYPAKSMPCLIFVDRQQGAVQKLEKAGFERIVVVYNLLDIVFAFGEKHLWPKSAVRAVEEEIRAHQFT